MSTSMEFQPAAGDWAIMPVAAEDAEQFANLLNTKEHWGLSALGILHAAQMHFAHHPDLQEATLVYDHDEMVWSMPAKQLGNSLSAFGYHLRLNPVIDEIARKGRYVLFEGQMPPPDEIMAVPGLAFLRRQLAYSASKGSRPHGFNYTSFTREGAAADGIVLGFANPAVGARMELDVPLTPLKQKYGFPPKPPKLPRYWGPQL